jgi:hypothetical protein
MILLLFIYFSLISLVEEKQSNLFLEFEKFFPSLTNKLIQKQETGLKFGEVCTRSDNTSSGDSCFNSLSASSISRGPLCFYHQGIIPHHTIP